MLEILTNKIDELIALCEKHRVMAISVFGSAVRDSMTTDSDIDFLVKFSDEINVLDYADNYFSLLDGLEELSGRSVDLISVNSIRNPVLREEINRSKIDLYAA